MAIKSINPNIKVYGVSMERGCAMFESQQAGKPILVEELETLADSLGGGIGLDNQHTFSMVRDYVDELILVNEQQIADAISHAYWQEQEVIEGSGAVGISAVMANLLPLKGHTVVVVSGRNIDMTTHQQIINNTYECIS
jgi:L-threonine ammonia-lyase (EC 4.3.1.19)